MAESDEKKGEGIPPAVLETIISSLQASRELANASQQGQVEQATAIAVLRRDVEAIDKKLCGVFNAINGNGTTEGMKTAIATLHRDVRDIKKSVDSLSGKMTETRSIAFDAQRGVDQVSRDQGTGKAMVEGWWKLILILVPGLLALLMQVLKMMQDG